MKKILNCVLITIIFLGLTHPVSIAQQNNETEIRNLENLEREAVLKGDTTSLFTKYWSPNMVINTPANRVGTLEGTKIGLRTGKLDYSSFERVIEKITCIENIAIVMGHEILKPKGLNDNVGKIVTRRFTNIWMKEKDEWRIIARQSTIISVL